MFPIRRPPESVRDLPPHPPPCSSSPWCARDCACRNWRPPRASDVMLRYRHLQPRETRCCRCQVLDFLVDTSPGVLAAVVIVEPPGVARAELRDDPTHGTHALLR